MALGSEALKHQFDDLQQQEESATLGMWLFLGTEIMLFGGLFLGYAVYRLLYPEAWIQGSHENYIWIGTLNTAILLISSLTMALAVHGAEEERWRLSSYFLIATATLGAIFLGLKFYEYYLHYHHHVIPGGEFHVEGTLAPQIELFMYFYFAMTGLHATHMTIGIGIVLVMAWLAWHEKLAYHVPVEVSGLYWHLVDIIWVFLYPLLYLIG